MQYLAVDIGTTFVKGAALDLERLTLGDVQRLPAPAPRADATGVRHELDPLAVSGAVRDLVDRLLVSEQPCAGLLLSGQMGGLVLVTPSGEPLTRYISWLDRRTATPDPGTGETSFERFAQILGDTWPDRLGREVRPGLPLPFLYHLRCAGELPAGTALPCTLPDFVAAHLCGTAPVMEWTAMTGSLDFATRSWPTELIQELGLDGLRWPEIVDFRRQAGTFEASSGAAIPVYAAVGDHQCSLTGTFLQPGELSVNISTGSQVAMLADAFAPGGCQQRPFFDGQLLRTVTNLPAGRALNAWLKLLTEIPAAQGVELRDPWPWILEQAERLSGSDVDVNLALFPSPVAGPGQIGNLREDNLTVGHLFRAALQQMAVDYDRFAGHVAPERMWDRVVFSGGLAQSSVLLRQLICARLGQNARVATSKEDTLLGLLVLARVVAGLDATVAESMTHVQRHRTQTS